MRRIFATLLVAMVLMAGIVLGSPPIAEASSVKSATAKITKNTVTTFASVEMAIQNSTIQERVTAPFGIREEGVRLDCKIAFAPLAQSGPTIDRLDKPPANSTTATVGTNNSGLVLRL